MSGEDKDTMLADLGRALALVLALDDGDTPYWWDGRPADVLAEVEAVFYRFKEWKP